MAKKLALAVDLDKCMRCYSCFVACKQENNVDDGIQFTRVYTVGPTIYKQYYWKPTIHFLSLQCNHCDSPACAVVCPVHAITKRADGIVFLDENLCIGCQKCVAACPYGIPQFNAGKFVAEKCNMCTQRIDQGLTPSCVKHCLTHARVFGDLNDPNSDVSKLLAAGGLPYHPEYGTSPTTRYLGLPTPLMAVAAIDGAKDEVLESCTVTLTDLLSGDTQKLTSDEWGDIQFEGISRNRTYSLKAEKDGYLPKFLGVVNFTEDVLVEMKLFPK